MPQRLGVYGGTFDPIHIGHLIIAEHAREQLQLDQVLFVPSGNPPHKQTAQVTSAKRRQEMVELAIAGNEAFGVCDFEVQRETFSYTVETLRFFGQRYAESRLFLILGADNLTTLPDWHQPAEIAERAHLCFAGRPGSELDFSTFTSTLFPNGYRDDLLLQLHSPLVDISSSMIRQRLAEGKSIRYLLPAAVQAYINSHHLYV